MFYQARQTVSEMRAALPSGATYVCRPANNTIEHRNAAGARVIRLQSIFNAGVSEAELVNILEEEGCL